MKVMEIILIQHGWEDVAVSSHGRYIIFKKGNIKIWYDVARTKIIKAYNAETFEPAHA